MNNSSSSHHNTHAWVRTDLVEAIWRNDGVLPKGWRPRQRTRDQDDWGWCRAMVVSSGAPPPSSPERTKDANATPNDNQSPFNVKLRKITNSPIKQQAWNRGSPDRFSKTVHITLTVDDDELAPEHLQNVTVSLTYNTGDTSQVCMANAWWQSHHYQEPPQDLCSLEQLHEPAVVFCLQERYRWDHIYTYTGKILLALNPFRHLDDLYGEDVMQLYCQQDFRSGRPPPHIYATAEDAYRSMMRSLQHKKENQSILVSGESGAGKTVTTKIIMRYLATLSQRSEHRDADASIEAQVLQSNPILESFGNARTIRNDNSSRFGKFIEIQFGTSGSLVSAKIETYLLEKVRLISQAPGERNYHIFYELLTGLPQRDRRDLKIGNVTPKDFRMTANSGTFDRRDGVDDKDTYRELRSALDTVGFTRQEQNELFTVACALLHTSNLTFRESGADASTLDRSNPSLRSAVSLLGVDVDALNKALCQCAIEARGETLYKNLSIPQAQKAVEALIKATYGALFMHIVRRINSFITVQQESSRAQSTASIGVLDIFGFESFEHNSFEQLCINYCNEALQQQFNRFVFKLEQQEYQREGIEWSFISFPDNQDVLDLIEKRHDGIFSVLDEQSRLQRCTDKSFALAVYEKCQEHPRFQATKSQQATFTFSIQHYAGFVEYATDNFLEKNKDELPKETTELLMSSSYPFLVSLGRLLCDMPTSNHSPNKKQLVRSSSSIMRDSVGSQFSYQLRELRKRIESTAPHYVRCLKPNDDLVPHNFNALVIADQLRCAGVLEAIRVSRVGFPHRYYHDHFVQRYSVLAHDTIARRGRGLKGRDLCDTLVEVLIPQVSRVLNSDEDKEQVKSRQQNGVIFLGMQMGRTKVFLRRSAFEALEHLRNKMLAAAAIKIQSFSRMAIAQMRYEISIYAAILIQNFFRKVGAHRLFQAQRQYHAARVIQCSWRCYDARRLLHAAYCIAWWCQSVHRGVIARQYCAYVFLDRKASSIQRAWRKHHSSRTLRTVRRAVVSLQTRQRSKTAKKELYRLRREARDVASVAAERDKLREESRRLRDELEKEKKKSPAIVYKTPRKEKKEKAEEMEKLRLEVQRLQLELDKAHRIGSPSTNYDEEVQSLVEEVKRKEEQLELLREELESLRALNDSYSVSVQSFFADDSPLIKFPNHATKNCSPIRSDVSLLDTVDTDGPGIGDEILPVGRQVVPSAHPFLSSDDRRADSKQLQHLHVSIRQGKRDLFEKILEQTDDRCLLINEGDKHGRTALHLAAIALDLELAETLIEYGAVVNVQDEDGETPLHLSENAAMTELLLSKGKANANIPNIDGICALHLAVQRRDIDSVRALLRKNANVNNADNIRWFTPLHLIALSARDEDDENHDDDIRVRIAHLLTGSFGASAPDLDFQDSEGNSPLHYAVQLATYDACDLVSVFLEKGADPNVKNERNQSPLHLLCHNDELRSHDIFQKIVHTMLHHGADPSLQSLTGCTPLHLSLYHKDVDSAVQLVSKGAELHLLWKKPKRWTAFWDDKGSSDILALDMVEDGSDLHRILAAITSPHKWAPARSWCMHCKSALGTFSRALHCRHCSRLICGNCASSCLPPEDFPKNFEVQEASWVCLVCEKILTARKEDLSSGTHPSSSYGEDDVYEC